jgi:pimeloyl-ACP methyl ester carboxylesterase
MNPESEAPRSVTLSDGRTLAYAEYGDPSGSPVFYFHGFPGSRLEPSVSRDAMSRLGLRVIAADRPGFGQSDPKPGRRIVDWPADVAELADALELPRFAVMGVSGGGPYSLACAHEIPDRLTQAAVVCGVGPFDAEGATTGMNTMNRILFGSARYTELLPRLFMAFMARAIRKDPAKAMQQMISRMPEPDRAVLSSPGFMDEFAKGASESFRQGVRPAGYEASLYARDWGFRLGDIEREVHLFQGELDVNVPPVMGRWQANALRNCRARFYPEEGHISLLVNQLGDIAAALTTPIAKAV